jgi:MFS family permease
VNRQVIFLASLLLASLYLHYVSNSGIWAYFERIGVAYGMSAETAGAILGPSMSAAIIGMTGAAILGDRLGYLRPIYIGTVIIMLSTLSLLYSSSPVVFGIATGVFNASITFVTPYFIAFLALLIPSGLGVSSANIAMMAGFSTGPFIVSFLIAGDDFRPSIILTAAGFVVVLGMVYFFSRFLQDKSVGQERVKQLCEIPRSRQLQL